MLLRSAICLALVFAWMPSREGEVMRAAGEVATNLADHARAAARIGCSGSAVACGVVLLAADRAIASAAEPTTEPARTRPAGNAVARNAAGISAARTRNQRPSANSLTASDLAAPWRGHKTKSGA
jgi:hypothetical protein